MTDVAGTARRTLRTAQRTHVAETRQIRRARGAAAARLAQVAAELADAVLTHHARVTRAAAATRLSSVAAHLADRILAHQVWRRATLTATTRLALASARLRPHRHDQQRQQCGDGKDTSPHGGPGYSGLPPEVNRSFPGCIGVAAVRDSSAWQAGVGNRHPLGERRLKARLRGARSVLRIAAVARHQQAHRRAKHRRERNRMRPTTYCRDQRATRLQIHAAQRTETAHQHMVRLSRSQRPTSTPWFPSGFVLGHT